MEEHLALTHPEVSPCNPDGLQRLPHAVWTAMEITFTEHRGLGIPEGEIPAPFSCVTRPDEDVEESQPGSLPRISEGNTFLKQATFLSALDKGGPEAPKAEGAPSWPFNDDEFNPVAMVPATPEARIPITINASFPPHARSSGPRHDEAPHNRDELATPLFSPPQTAASTSSNTVASMSSASMPTESSNKEDI
ncbi:hypothetical protein DFH08DRAFT_951024 [Mycena albidolilacea]|uniref:Uncharacterized protein n=1 Tax=Mycena albidolilacea TaxID=1033008 RepID=A0AAD7F2E3_9AGAR|nr:hypothetical protein DFH08DRAFT_951024 [Mycena albidolilacea]